MSECATLIQPYMNNCCSSWYSGLSVALRERLNVIQRKMVRFVFSMVNRAHFDNRNLRELIWLSVPDRVKFFRMAHLFRICHKLAPTYLLHNFKLVSAAHSYNTRGSANNFHLSRDLSLFPSGFAYQAIKQWNSLPEDIKSIDQFKVFKKKLKQFLITQYE